MKKTVSLKREVTKRKNKEKRCLRKSLQAAWSARFVEPGLNPTCGYTNFYDGNFRTTVLMETRVFAPLFFLSLPESSFFPYLFPLLSISLRLVPAPQTSHQCGRHVKKKRYYFSAAKVHTQKTWPGIFLLFSF